jgi:hypothetical protein
MSRKNALIILYLTGAVVMEEAHQLFSKYLKVKIHPFPFDDTKISVQWYVYDLSNCISAVLIALAFYTALATKNMKDIALVFLGYRILELIFFILWDKQLGYVQLLLLFGYVLFIIITQWKNK